MAGGSGRAALGALALEGFEAKSRPDAEGPFRNCFANAPHCSETPG